MCIIHDKLFKKNPRQFLRYGSTADTGWCHKSKKSLKTCLLGKQVVIRPMVLTLHFTLSTPSQRLLEHHQFNVVFPVPTCRVISSNHLQMTSSWTESRHAGSNQEVVSRTTDTASNQF